MKDVKNFFCSLGFKAPHAFKVLKSIHQSCLLEEVNKDKIKERARYFKNDDEIISNFIGENSGCIVMGTKIKMFFVHSKRPIMTDSKTTHFL